jgi:hypothetical protein
VGCSSTPYRPTTLDATGEAETIGNESACCGRGDHGVVKHGELVVGHGWPPDRAHYRKEGQDVPVAQPMGEGTSFYCCPAFECPLESVRRREGTVEKRCQRGRVGCRGAASTTFWSPWQRGEREKRVAQDLGKSSTGLSLSSPVQHKKTR